MPLPGVCRDVSRSGARTTFWVVAVLALMVRLVHLWFFSNGTPFFDPAPWSNPDNPMDPGEYDRWAMQITHGGPWWTDHGQGTYFQSPVYPYFVAALYRVAQVLELRELVNLLAPYVERS